MRTNEHIPVDYILERKGRKWMIRDVIIDGVGTVETYRNGFGAFLRNNSFDDSYSEDGNSEKSRRRALIGITPPDLNSGALGPGSPFLFLKIGFLSDAFHLLCIHKYCSGNLRIISSIFRFISTVIRTISERSSVIMRVRPNRVGNESFKKVRIFSAARCDNDNRAPMPDSEHRRDRSNCGAFSEKFYP